MIESAAAVESAFKQTLAALDAEIAEYRRLGGEIFHNGAPRNAQTLLRRANDRAALRDKVAAIFEEWKSAPSNPAPPPTPQPSTSFLRMERAQPGLIRNIRGMTTQSAAKQLGVPPAKVLEWLGAGLLKGYQKVGGTWKITRPDLIAFTREHRDLWVAATSR